MGYTTLITGPGTHAQLIINDLIKKEGNFQVAEYWPYPKILKYLNGKKKYEKKFRFYNLINHFVWGIFNKINQTHGYKRHLDILFPLYDFIISRYLAKTDLLIAWPQVSYYSIRKIKKRGRKVILEFPMIHVDAWMKIMTNEYNKFNVKRKNCSNLFSPFMINRIYKEIELADEVNVLSPFAKKTFLNAGIHENKIQVRKIRLVDEFFTINQDLKIKNKFIILFAGRVNLLKGVHLLLKAFNQLEASGCELWIAGEIENEIISFIKKYKTDQVKILGFQNRMQLRKLYQQASVLVLPSIQESFGLVILEALQCGLPVIASRNSGGPEIIKDGFNGFLYDPQDIESLKRILINLNNDKNLLKELSGNTKKLTD